MTSVLFTSRAFQQRTGGISRYFSELHAGLLAAGVTSRVVAGLHDNRYLEAQPRVSGFRIADFPGRGKTNALFDAATRTVSGRAVLHDSW